MKGLNLPVRPLTFQEPGFISACNEREASLLKLEGRLSSKWLTNGLSRGFEDRLKSGNMGHTVQSGR